jgi:predicted nuclease of predicted toxin-antitoxin system
MNYRFLIDECLSPDLVQLAIDAGFECTCIRDRGLLGAQDRKILEFLLEEDFTLVTTNVADFLALFGAEKLHAGLVCLSFSTHHSNLEAQREFFQIALEALGEDLVNQVLEVAEDAVGHVTVSMYEHAAPEDADSEP